MPYLYTRVRCCHDGVALEAKYDEGGAADGLLRQDSAANLSRSGRVASCDVQTFGADDPRWSHSASCVNFAFVRNTAQEVRGVYQPLSTLIKVVILPVGGFCESADATLGAAPRWPADPPALGSGGYVRQEDGACDLSAGPDDRAASVDG